MCQFNEEDKRNVGLIARGWFDSFAPTSSNGASGGGGGIGSEFVNFLENELLEEQVREADRQEAEAARLENGGKTTDM